MDLADRNAAKPEKNGGKYVVSVGGIKVIPSEEKQKNLAVKGVQPQDITLGAQPSHITLGSGEKTLTAKVDASEMIGNEVYLHTNAMSRDVIIIVSTMDFQGNP